MSLSAPTAPRDRRQRGFALLITITLLAFLVLLLVSLASLTRVETQVASNTQQLAQARQNALTALNIALGELQKYAGPDQRATARAEILDTDPATPAIDGVNQPHWTGVWGNANNPQSDTSSAPVPLQWLVSGNERTDFNPSTQVSFAEASFGQISNAATTAASRVFTPMQAIDGLTTSATVNTTVTVNNQAATLLVGPGTAEGVENYVVAPLRNIEVPQSSIPGMGTATTLVPVGRYAWWVGDEGVKARANLVDPYVTPTQQMSVATDVASRSRLMAPQRLATERVSGFENFPENNDLARKILNLEQADLAHASITPAVRKSRFHDLTTTATGVLADQRRGGLKRDLTYAFARNEGDFRTALALPAPTANPIIPTSIMPANDQGPTWEQLRSYSLLDGTSPIRARAQTATEHGIYPVLVQARLIYGWTAQETGNVTAGGEKEYRLILYIAPAFVLANPYNTDIQAGFYRVRIDLDDATSGANMRYFSAYLGLETTPLWRQSLSALFEGQDFRLNCRENLAAGEARVFTLVNDGDPWAAEKTYELEDDWSEFAIRLDTGARFGESVLYVKNGSPTLTGKGIHFFFSSPDSAPAWQVDSWTGPMAQANPYGNGNGGTLSWTLLDDNQEFPTVYQRLQTFGYNAQRLTERGVRGTGSPALAPYNGSGFTPPDPNSPRFFGGHIIRMADAGIWTGSNSGASSSYIAPYYSQFNWRAPLISRTNIYNSREGQGPTVSWRGYHRDGGTAHGQSIRLKQGDTRRVFWNGVVGQTADQNLARDDWRPFDVPRPEPGSVPRPETGVISLGQFQHVNTGGFNDGYAYPERKSPLSTGIPTPSRWVPRYISPTFAIGNSRAHPNVAANAVSATHSNQPFYDLSYLLNRQLFDGYFFSTYPQQGAVDLASYRLQNSRLAPFRDNVATYEAFRGGNTFDPNDVFLAARNLKLSGAFNVNSTSVEAWTAFLSSLRGTTLRNEPDLEGPFVRSVNQSQGTTRGAERSSDGTSDLAWNGFRSLTAAQIDALAREVVAQIKTRGVAVSLADFINRSLTLANSNTAGAIQAAVDATNQSANVNERINGGFPTSINNQLGNPINNLTPGGTLFDHTAHLAKHLLEGIAGWVSQADIVQALAPSIAARSDTFRIRTYGETINPVTQQVIGRAWCEATVQRLPDYVSSDDDATVAPSALSQPSNRQFGRRFEIINFRWLSPEEI